MLVLSRKAGEKVQIGNGIVVTVTRISGGRVTLAIEAPHDVRILRGELAPHLADAPATESEPAAGPSVTPSKPKLMMPGTSPLATALPPVLARRAMIAPPTNPNAVPPTTR